jgi:hypothetical protein
MKETAMPPATALAAAVAAAALLAVATAAPAPAAKPAKAAPAAAPVPLRSWAVGRPTFTLASAAEGAAVKFFEGAKPPIGLPKEELTHEPLNLTYAPPTAAAAPWVVASPPHGPGWEAVVAGEGGDRAVAAAETVAAWRANVSDLPYPVVAPPAVRRAAQAARTAWARANAERATLDDADDAGGGNAAAAPAPSPPSDAPAPNATLEEGERLLVDGEWADGL